MNNESTNKIGRNIILIIISGIVLILGIYVLVNNKLPSFLVKKESGPDYKKLTFIQNKKFTTETNSKKEVVYNYRDKNNSCSYLIKITTPPNSVINYLNTKDNYSVNDSKGQVTTININSVDWYMLRIDTKSNDIIYEYAINYKHVLYNLTYNIYEDNNKCSELMNEITNSLEFKKK